MIRKLKTIIWKEGRYFIAQSLDIDVCSFGETKAEAIDNLKEALELYFQN